jgi:hypothetical protein
MAFCFYENDLLDCVWIFLFMVNLRDQVCDFIDFTFILGIVEKIGMCVEKRGVEVSLSEICILDQMQIKRDRGFGAGDNKVCQTSFQPVNRLVPAVPVNG